MPRDENDVVDGAREEEVGELANNAPRSKSHRHWKQQTSDSNTASLVELKRMHACVDAELKDSVEELSKRKVHADQRMGFLKEILGNVECLKMGIPGQYPRLDDAVENRLLDLVFRMDQAGVSPATEIDGINEQQARRKVVERAAVHNMAGRNRSTDTVEEARRVQCDSLPFSPWSRNLQHLSEAGVWRDGEMSFPPWKEEPGADGGGFMSPLRQPVELVVRGMRVRTTVCMRTPLSRSSTVPALGSMNFGSSLGQRQQLRFISSQGGGEATYAAAAASGVDGDGNGNDDGDDSGADWPASDSHERWMSQLQQESDAKKEGGRTAKAGSARYSSRAEAPGGAAKGGGDRGGGDEALARPMDVIQRAVEMPQLRRLRGTKVTLDGFLLHRLEVDKEAVRRLDEALLATEAREKVLNDEVRIAMGEFREASAAARGFAEGAAAVRAALAVPEQKSAPPANSLYHAVEQNWDGHEYEKFVEKTRHLFGESSDEYFVATQVMKSQQNAVLHGGGGAYPEQAWAVPGRNLGAGGFGSVDQLDVPTLGMSFAVKSLKKAPTDGGRDDDWLAMCAIFGLVTEMVVHNRMSAHPNIAQVVALDDRNQVDHLAVIYELAEGDFTSYAWGQDSVSMAVLMRLMSDMARGLQHLTSYSLAHNDFKPENVLIFKDPQGDLVAKIADLGLALAHGDMRAGHGTTGGRPPEGMLYRKVPCEASQDVYAFAHLMLMTFTKCGWKSSNMWVSKSVLTAEDIRTCDHQISKEDQRAFVEKITLRNQIDPRTRAALLNADRLDDRLGDYFKGWLIDLLVAALSPDPAQRPSMLEMATQTTAMTMCLLEKETQAANQAAAAVAKAAESAAAAATAKGAPSGAVPKSALSQMASTAGGGDPGGTAGGAAVGGDADGRAVPVPESTIPEVVPEGDGGERDAAPEVVVVPAVVQTVQMVQVGGGASAGDGDGVEGVSDDSNDGEISSLAPTAPTTDTTSGVTRPSIVHVPLSKGAAGDPSGGGSSVAQLPCSGAINGGPVARLLEDNDEGAGGAAVDHPRPPKSLSRMALPCADGASVNGGGWECGARNRGGKTKRVTPVVAMSSAASFRGNRTGTGSEGRGEGSGCKGQYSSCWGTVGPAGPVLDNTAARASTTGGIFHARRSPAVARGGSGPLSGQQYHSSQPGSRGRRRKKRPNNGTKSRSSAGGHYRPSKSFRRGHQPVVPTQILPQPLLHRAQAWGTQGGAAAAFPYFQPSVPSALHQQVRREGGRTRVPYSHVPPQPPYMVPPYYCSGPVLCYDPVGVGGGGGGGGDGSGTWIAQHCASFTPCTPYWPCYPGVAAVAATAVGHVFPIRGQTLCGVV